MTSCVIISVDKLTHQAQSWSPAIVSDAMRDLRTFLTPMIDHRAPMAVLFYLIHDHNLTSDAKLRILVSPDRFYLGPFFIFSRFVFLRLFAIP